MAFSYRAVARSMHWLAVDRYVSVVYLHHVRNGARRIRNVREGTVGQIEGPRLVVGQSLQVQSNRSRVDDEIGKVERTAEVRKYVACLAKVAHGGEDGCTVEAKTVKRVDVHIPDEPSAPGI